MDVLAEPMNPDVERAIRDRTPLEWYGLASPQGWDDIVEDLFLDLVARHPDLEIHQIKEKFGGLRFYCNVGGPEVDALIRNAENAAWKTCQVCGGDGKTVESRGWYATLCPVHEVLWARNRDNWASK